MPTTALRHHRVTLAIVNRPSAPDYADELALMVRLADAADAISMGRFRAEDLHIERKPDLSPVTEADRAIETMIRDVLARERPDDAIIGEEFGATGSPGARWRWVLDPIDGTKSYARGDRNWATLIAVQHEGTTVAATASMGAFGERAVATRGGGSWIGPTRLATSAVANIADATLAHTSVGGFTWSHNEDDLLRLARECWNSRGFGNSVSHLSVARGSADLAWTSWAYEWDFAALALIVEEAGGRFTDLDGNPATGGAGFSSNGLLHDAALGIIRGADITR